MKKLKTIEITLTNDEEFISLGEDKKIITCGDSIASDIQKISTLEDLFAYLDDKKGCFIEENPLLIHEIDIKIDFKKQFEDYVAKRKL